jgi:hypothetical protein
MRIAELDGTVAARWRFLGEHGSLLGGLCSVVTGQILYAPVSSTVRVLIVF